MSFFGTRPGYSTSTEAALLTQLANLAVGGAGTAIQKTGTNSFANVTLPTSGGSSGGGSGTVTSVSWVTSQGVSAAISNPTTTPSITVTLGALTAVTSVNGLIITANTGVITTGTWNGSAVAANYGGTGVLNNVANTITFSGNYGLTITLSNTTSVTFPVSGTLVNTAVTTLSSLVSVGTITTGGLGTGATIAGVTMALGSDAVGDMYYAGSSEVLTRLAAVAVGSVLISKGTGTAPAWSTMPAAINFLEAYSTTVTSGSTVTLLYNSNYQQYFTGSTAQLVTLPTTSVVQGQQFNIVNQSTAAVTVQSSGSNTVIIVAAGTSVILTALVATPTTAANWSAQYLGASAVSGGSLTTSGVYPIVLTATASTNVTLPASGTLVNTAVTALSSLVTVGTITSGGLGTGATLGAVTVNIASTAVGDIWYAGASNVMTRLADVAAGQPLLSGGVTTAPAYAGYTFSGTASATYTFPGASKTLAANDGSNWTLSSQTTGDLMYASSGTAMGRIAAVASGSVLASAGTSTIPAYTTQPTLNGVIYGNNAITASGNAATIPVTSEVNTVTNNSAATLTITLTTSGAANRQITEVLILDASGVAQTITWVNTENSGVTAPTTSNGSTTLPLAVQFQYNLATTKWRCIGFA